jgi:hypothetical protein
MLLRLVRLWYWATRTKVLPVNFETDLSGNYVNLRAPTFLEAWKGIHD